MRLMFWTSLGAALLALGLTFTAFTRVHLTKVSTEQALASVVFLPQPGMNAIDPPVDVAADR